MHSTSILRILLLALTLAVVAACGSTGAAAPAESQATSPAEVADPTTDPADGAAEAEPTPGTTLNACEIVTAEDVAAAADLDSVQPGTLEMSPTVLSPGRSECTYEAETVRVIVELTPEDGENLYDAAAGAYKDMVVIDGLGDGAFWSEQNHRAFVWQGAVTLMFTIFTGADVDPAEFAAEIGDLALAKI